MLLMSSPTVLKVVAPAEAAAPAPVAMASDPPASQPASVPNEDTLLVKRARNGDMAAYDDLIRRYQERIHATIYHMTANHEDANDLP